MPGEGNVGLDDTVSNLSLIFRFDTLNEENKILHQGDVTLISGDFKEGADPGQDENYTVLDFNYSLLTFWKVPFTESLSRLIYRTSFQYASSSLSSINQFSLAGPTRARGYSVNQFSADNAVYMGVDWVLNAPEWLDIPAGASNLKQILSPFIFVDASWGESLSLSSTQPDTTAGLVNAGVGVQFSYLDNIRGNLQLAFPIKDDFNSQDITVDDDSVRLVFDFQYNFL